jgi:hypothetical protein
MTTHTVPQRRTTRLKAGASLAALATLAALSGCVVAPVPYREAPPRVVYVAPTYPSPGVGWVWMAHPVYGWGWHHPDRGWHRGWRD